MRDSKTREREGVQTMINKMMREEKKRMEGNAKR